MIHALVRDEIETDCFSTDWIRSSLPCGARGVAEMPGSRPLALERLGTDHGRRQPPAPALSTDAYG